MPAAKRGVNADVLSCGVFSVCRPVPRQRLHSLHWMLLILAVRLPIHAAAAAPVTAKGLLCRGFFNVHISRSHSSSIMPPPLPSASKTCRRIQKKSVWDFYLSKISAAPHAGNRRDVNSKATCGIAVVSFLIGPLFHSGAVGGSVTNTFSQNGAQA